MKFVEVEKVDIAKRPGRTYFVGLQSAMAESHAREQVAKIDGKTPEGERDQMAHLLLMYVANEDGSPRFANVDAAKQFMSEESQRTCWTLIRAAQKLNGLTDEAVEGEEKN
jgi:hypothetical protein